MAWASGLEGSQSGSVLEAPALESLRPIFQSVEKYCEDDLGAGGWARHAPSASRPD